MIYFFVHQFLHRFVLDLQDRFILQLLCSGVQAATTYLTIVSGVRKVDQV